MIDLLHFEDNSNRLFKAAGQARGFVQQGEPRATEQDRTSRKMTHTNYLGKKYHQDMCEWLSSLDHGEWYLLKDSTGKQDYKFCYQASKKLESLGFMEIKKPTPRRTFVRRIMHRFPSIQEVIL